MNEIRLVAEGAEIFKPCGEFNPDSICDDPFACETVKLSDTIPVQSPWTVEQAAELLKLTWNDMMFIADTWRSSRIPMTGFSFVKQLITLAIAHTASGLSLEDFIGEMEEASNAKDS